MQSNVINQACDILRLKSPVAKAEAALSMRKDWLGSDKSVLVSPKSVIPENPARPDKPVLVAPSEVPRRRLGSSEGRGALLHAIAHIELNAIDLAADMIARFSLHPLLENGLQTDFVHDWTRVCAEEAKHFKLLSGRLSDLNMAYGDHPAHNGLWEAAYDTRHDIAGRLAIAPLVLEARGLDVTPGMIKKLQAVGDKASVKILEIIYNEEIGHVKIGAFWFQIISKRLKKDPKPYFHEMVNTYFAGKLKPPFNIQARTLAGLTEGYYKPLSKC